MFITLIKTGIQSPPLLNKVYLQHIVVNQPCPHTTSKYGITILIQAGFNLNCLGAIGQSNMTSPCIRANFAKSAWEYLLGEGKY